MESWPPQGEMLLWEAMYSLFFSSSQGKVGNYNHHLSDPPVIASTATPISTHQYLVAMSAVSRS